MTTPKRYRPILIILAVGTIILLTMLPLILARGAQFGGSDLAGAVAVERLAPEYDSGWAANWWTPERETESMLFALQAAAGGVLIGYFFGYVQGRKSAHH
jgi:cobalt/nickel transport protein